MDGTRPLHRHGEQGELFESYRARCREDVCERCGACMACWADTACEKTSDGRHVWRLTRSEPVRQVRPEVYLPDGVVVALERLAATMGRPVRIERAPERAAVGMDRRAWRYSVDE